MMMMMTIFYSYATSIRDRVDALFAAIGTVLRGYLSSIHHMMENYTLYELGRCDLVVCMLMRFKGVGCNAVTKM